MSELGLNLTSMNASTVNDTGQPDPDQEYDHIYVFVMEIVQIILFSVVCLVGLIGNTLVIYVVIRFSKMQTVTNMYIVNLAIADECFLIGIPFLVATMIQKHWIFGYFACKAYMISTSINQFTSSILLCIMSADRYVAVCHPISSPRWRTPFISKVVSLLAWTFSICLIIPIIQHAKEEDYDGDGRASCIIVWDPSPQQAPPAPPFNDTPAATQDPDLPPPTPQPMEGGTAAPAKIFTMYTFFCGFFVPLCLILVFYYLVIRKLKTVGPKNKSKEKRRSHRKVTSLVLTVVTVYVICWLPYWISQLAINGSTDKFSVTLHLLASFLSYSNSAINPILYAFLSDNFKKSFVKACTCAANKDINATLQLENSVFPKKNKQGSERFRPARTRTGTSICADGDADANRLLSSSGCAGGAASSGRSPEPRETTTAVIGNGAATSL